MTDHKQQLQSQLWNIANDLRGNMGADEFRDYILGFIFFKYLSEKVQLWADKQLKSDGITFIDLITHTEREDYLEGLAEESVGALGFFLKPHQLFSVLAARGGEHSDGHDTLIQDVEEAFRDIEQSVAGAESSDDFDGLFNEIDLYSTKLGKDKPQRSKLIGKVLIHLNKIDFQLENTEIDVLGDAYEYLISQFASGAGKKAGEFYTPQEVSSILSKIVTTGKDRLESVYDPTCGSGSLLLRVAKEVEKVGMFYGQEMNPTTYNLARMNMILHDVSYRYFDIKQDDTLERPQHDGQLFEAIVANPPFSAKWSADSLKMDEPRFGMYGKLAPSSKADYAFVTHMLHHLDHSGTMALVLPHGALFRGAAEGHIRKHIIEECNWLDAVIGLPANIFYGTSIPTCIMVFKKNRSYDDAVLFIDASNEFEKQKNQNYLKDEHIEKIVQTYRDREALDKYSYNATLDEIKENDYNLNIPRYVDSFEEEESISLKDVEVKLNDLNLQLIKVEEAFKKDLSKLGIMQKVFSQQVRYKREDGSDYPDWSNIRLEDLCLLCKSGGTPKSTVPEYYDGDIPFLAISDITEQGKYLESTSKSISNLGLDNSAAWIVPEKSIIYSMYASVGFVSINLIPMATSQAVLNLVVNEELCDVEFLYYWLYQFQRKVHTYVTTGTQGNLNAQTVKSFEVDLPCLEEQRKIVTLLSTIDTKISLMEETITEVKSFKKGLLQQMFV